MKSTLIDGTLKMVTLIVASISVTTVRCMNNRTLLMYVVTGEKRPIFYESDAFLYNLCDPY
jgi:hypothetical protein